MKHLASLITLLIHQLVADGQQAGETGLDNFIKVLSIIAVGRFVAESAADGKKTLQASEDGARVIGVEELESEVHEPGPTGREIILKDSLENGDKLLANEAFGGSEDGQKAVSDASLFVFGDECSGRLRRVALVVIPGSIDAVLDVDDG